MTIQNHVWDLKCSRGKFFCFLFFLVKLQKKTKKAAITSRVMFTVHRGTQPVKSADPLNSSSLPFPQIEGGQSFMLVSQRTPVKPD